MFQNHKNNNKNNNEISSSYSKTSQHHPYYSHHKSVRPTQAHLLHAKEHKSSPASVYPSRLLPTKNPLPHNCPRAPSSMHLANSYQRGSFRNFQQRSYPSNKARQPLCIHLLFLEQHPSSNYRPFQRAPAF